MAAITLTIPDNKIRTAKDGLLAVHPVPTALDAGGNPVPIMGENAWLKEWLRRKLRDEIARGLQKLGRDAVAYSPDDQIAS